MLIAALAITLLITNDQSGADGTGARITASDAGSISDEVDGAEIEGMSLAAAQAHCQSVFDQESIQPAPIQEFYRPAVQDYVDYWRPILEPRNRAFPVVQYTAIWSGGEANCVFGSDGSVEWNQYSVSLDISVD